MRLARHSTHITKTSYPKSFLRKNPGIARRKKAAALRTSHHEPCAFFETILKPHGALSLPFPFNLDMHIKFPVMTTPLPLGIILVLSLACGVAPARAQQTYAPGSATAAGFSRLLPDDMYLDTLKLVTQADELSKKHDYVAAIRLMQQAEEQFGHLAKMHPQYRPNLLQERRQLNKTTMEQWQRQAQQMAAAQPDASNFAVERPSAPAKPRLQPNIKLPSGYKGVEFPSRPGEPYINRLPSSGSAPGAEPARVESNYERVLRNLQQKDVENRALIEALQTTTKERNKALADVAMASIGESVYKKELLQLKKQITEEGRINNAVMKTLTGKVDELERKVNTLEKEKIEHLNLIANLQKQVQQQQQQLARLTDEKNTLKNERDQLAALVALNNPGKMGNILDRNLTLTAQLKDAQNKITELETAKSDSEEQRKANLRTLDITRGEVVDLKQKIAAIHDENIGYRKRITELNTKLRNADTELENMEAHPEESPLLKEENKLLRSTIAKQQRILFVQDQSRTLLFNTYKRKMQQNPEMADIAALMDDTNLIKLTPAEQELVNAIAKDNKIDVSISPEQKRKIDKLAQMLAAEKGSAEQMKAAVELARQKAGDAKTRKAIKTQEAALAKASEAMEQKNLQVADLTRQLDEMKQQLLEQNRLAAVAADKLSPEQNQSIAFGMEAAVRNKLTMEALGQGAAEAFAKKRYDAAEQLYRTLLDLQPAHVPAMVNLGTILLQLNKADEAITVLKKATEQDATSSPAWFMLGVAQYRAGMDMQALASLAETVKFDPGNATALLYMGNLETSAGHYDQAAGHFENALKLQPESPDTYFNLAWTYSKLEQTTRARKCYDEAIRRGGLPDSELELAITGTSTLPRRKTAAPPAAIAEPALPGSQEIAVSNPRAIPSDGREIAASVAENPNAVEHPSPDPKQLVVNHRPETETVSLPTKPAQLGTDAPQAPAQQAESAAQAIPKPPVKQEAPRRNRFRIGF